MARRSAPPGAEPSDPSARIELGLHCWIYKGTRSDETYLYLREAEGFDLVPQALMRLLGQPQLVMELDLHPGRKLAREDVLQVMEGLRSRGYFLQLPPAEPPTGMLS